MVTHWPACEADALVNKLADRLEKKSVEALVTNSLRSRQRRWSTDFATKT